MFATDDAEIGPAPRRAPTVPLTLARRPDHSQEALNESAGRRGRRPTGRAVPRVGGPPGTGTADAVPVAGLYYPDIADLTTADITISDGTARIRTRTATITVQSTDDTMLCGPCALARWLHLIDMTVIYPNGCVAAAVLARSAPLVRDSPHACQTTDTTVHGWLTPLVSSQTKRHTPPFGSENRTVEIELATL